MEKHIADLYAVVSAVKESSGTVWTLSGSEDLNANLVCFPDGRGVGEHVNKELDVLIVGVSGSGVVAVDDEEHTLSNGSLVLIPKGVRRWTMSSSENFAYLSVHHRRGPLEVGSRIG